MFWDARKRRVSPAAIRGIITVMGMGLVATASLAQGAQTFELFGDDFSGTVLDADKWNTTIATTGERWCSSTFRRHLTNSGNWQNAATEPCRGLTQAFPYGAVTINGGQASLRAGVIRTFPYIWVGPPSRRSPFPATGDFILELRMKYDAINVFGNGFSVLFWENTEPVGDNPPSPDGQGVFGVWADSGGGLRTGAAGSGPVAVADPLAFHDYRLEYIGGTYTLFVDGVLSAGPTVSALRPNTIWIGNPVFAFWSPRDWTDFTIDFIRVSTPNTPAERTGALSSRVEALVADGTLSSAQGTSLIKKLESAKRSWENGNDNAAVNKLAAFANQVQALIDSGRLSENEGQTLIDEANSIIDQILTD